MTQEEVRKTAQYMINQLADKIADLDAEKVSLLRKIGISQHQNERLERIDDVTDSMREAIAGIESAWQTYEIRLRLYAEDEAREAKYRETHHAM